jgi:putative oxidoreductase
VGRVKPWLQMGCLLIAGGFFIVAGASKLPDPVAFMDSIENYRLVRGLPAFAAAIYLPILEILAGLALFFRSWRKAGAVLLAGMLLIFEVALASAALRGLDIDCGCLGSGAASGVGFAFVRNLVLLALLFLGTYRGHVPERKSLQEGA